MLSFAIVMSYEMWPLIEFRYYLKENCVNQELYDPQKVFDLKTKSVDEHWLYSILALMFYISLCLIANTRNISDTYLPAKQLKVIKWTKYQVTLH